MRDEIRYERLSTYQEILSSVTTLSIENSVAQNHEFSEVVKIYGDVKARRVNFH